MIGRSCGVGEIVPMDCGDPLCPDCEKRRSKERRDHWKPVFEAMRNPRMITLTIRNGADLKERIKVFQKAFRKLLDYRYGPRNLARVAELARPFLEAHYAPLVDAGEITASESARRIGEFDKSYARFAVAVNQYKHKRDKWPRMRDLIGKGFATLEITCSDAEECWHVHRHLCVDGHFIPWAVLVCVWRVVTLTEGEIVDIRAMDNHYDRSINEVTKYLAKPWDVPNDKKGEFRGAVRGMKRIWPLGGAKPVIVERVCPYCADPSCKGHMLDTGEMVKKGKVGDTEIMLVRSLSDGQERIFALDPEKGWRSLPLDLIKGEIAWHSAVEHAP
jgi:hypothetical protein